MWPLQKKKNKNFWKKNDENEKNRLFFSFIGQVVETVFPRGEGRVLDNSFIVLYSTVLSST